MKTVYTDFSRAWLHELLDVIDNGEKSSPRGMATREVRWREFAVVDPLSFPLVAPGREFRDVIGVMEALSLVGQFSVPELFTDRVRKFADFADDGVFHGAYGTRVYGRLGDLVSLLRRDPDSRQAVLSVFDSRSDLGAAKRDVPCTISIQFLLRSRELEMKVSMRSNDAWLGMPYDFVQFGVLQASVAQALGVAPGEYTHSVGSLHFYERDLEKSRELKDFPLPGELKTTQFPLWHADPDIGAISSRARDIALGRAFPVTEFETWAHRLLWPAGTWYPGLTPWVETAPAVPDFTVTSEAEQ